MGDADNETKAAPFSPEELSEMRARVASVFKGTPEGLDLSNALRVIREVAGDIRYEAQRWLATVEQRDAEIERLREALRPFAREARDVPAHMHDDDRPPMPPRRGMYEDANA